MDQSRTQQYLIKICCFIAAFGLWLYITNIQNPIKTYKLQNVPVQVTNADSIAQSKFTLLPHQEYTVTLTIKGTSSDIRLTKPEQFKVIADLSGYVLKKGENRIPVEVKDSPSNINIVSSEMLWVKVNLDELIERSVPVKVELEGKAKEGFAAFEPIAKPTEALISGAAQYVNTVKNVVAKADIKNSDKELTLNLPVKAVDAAGRTVEEVKIQPNATEVVVPVRKMKTVGINIKTIGKLNKDVILGSIYSPVEKIDIAGNEAAIAEITTLDTEAIDLSSLDVSKDTVEAKLIVPKNVLLLNSNGMVSIKLVIDKVIQKNLSLAVQYQNIGEGYEVSSETDKVSLGISGTENILNALNSEDISCYADLNSLNAGEYVVPVVVKLPDKVSKISVNPQNIKVIIKKKTKE